ncbi:MULTISPECIES: hypothetical protein [unclassified Rhodococcus (in: high G+C Gram-positive bacteria)]|jgi:hypothetical protein|uniref:hypothetical protein n=1 Tax=unclassified Rhodococcus (in: high G+C Gram-positive bacteria) TaxID=192944 RepID=UPI0006F9B7B7|nr:MULTISPECIES: hypothetical protein [unclassified Rhodococcus (in: high G+C Gram-positive bacteria)]KQU39159.1 hypothetical protein ASG69_11785 [Rhodococcus sp. Leaf225]KQU43595.1 hypothetical protein ASH03_13460 [Rhodococcus sp. Leaf258]MBY6679015.1 hypothetical protein [Rhodococcus sp. BP-332]MBY6682828.1 hypothetical protein [Rhodococcus sp. BP-316]MBY6707615.1 hypothetical protein [Rhodococcus sp. BP-241]
MNTVTIVDGRLVVEPRGLDKLWSFTRRLDIPLSEVKGATVDTGVRREPRGIRAPGLSIPGKYAGTFHRDGEKVFWNVGDPVRNIVIELDGTGRFDRLVLTVDDPTRTENAVNAALAT